jgi:hypothetical protein
MSIYIYIYIYIYISRILSMSVSDLLKYRLTFIVSRT